MNEYNHNKYKVRDAYILQSYHSQEKGNTPQIINSKRIT